MQKDATAGHGWWKSQREEKFHLGQQEEYSLRTECTDPLMHDTLQRHRRKKPSPQDGFQYTGLSNSGKGFRFSSVSSFPVP